MQNLIVWGASGHAMVVADIIRLRGEYEIVGFLDDSAGERHAAEFRDAPVYTDRESLDVLFHQGVRHVIVAIGDCRARLDLANLVLRQGFELASAIHPGAIVAADASIGAGSVITAGAVVNPACKIGENVIINTCASIDHECTIGDGAHISPGAHLAGRVTVGRSSWVGIGACISNGVRIGSGSVIGAGAVVVRDVPDGVVAYGVPARIKREALRDDK